MKHILFLVVLITLGACSTSTTEKKTVEAQLSDGVEVIYFHGKKRCITCNAIENLTQDVLNTQFAEEMRSGKIVFRVIDISSPDNEDIVNKYEVTWSSLFVNQWKNGHETPNNLTKLGFEKAKNLPEEFKAEIRQVITDALK